MRQRFFEWTALCPDLENNRAELKTNKEWRLWVQKELQDLVWFKNHITGFAGPFRCNFSMDVLKVDGREPIRPTVKELKERLYGNDEKKDTKIPVWAADEQTKNISYDRDFLHSFACLCTAF